MRAIIIILFFIKIQDSALIIIGRFSLKMSRILIITISDSCSKDASQDFSGPALLEEVNKTLEPSEVQHKILPDDQELITKELINACDVGKFSAIFTTGGTGFAARDVTPEATRSVIEKEAPALATAMTLESLKHTDMAMLSRAVAGIRGKTLIVNLPGSVKAVKECYSAISKALPHAISLLAEDIGAVKNTHAIINSSSKAETHICTHKLTSSVDLSKVALRERNSPFPMLEVSVADSIVTREMSALFQQHRETRPLYDCLGLTPTRDVAAPDPLPPFPASIKDGYACIASDGAGVRKVRGAVCAGDVPQEALRPGECVRINTGAPLPLGADCVVQVEDTRLLRSSEDGRAELEIEITRAPRANEDVRPVGHDVRKGEVVVRKGALLDAGNIGILATVGTTKLEVYVQPAVGLLSTGNELQDPADEILRPGHIRDSNKIMLRVLLKEHGFETIDCGISRDDADSMKSHIASALKKVDILVTSGSVSMGEKDLLKPILVRDFGAEIHFGRVNMKPGKPTTFATCAFEGRRKYVFGLPGNPVSAFVTGLLFVVPALRRCVGLEGRWMRMRAALGSEARLDPRPEFARATLVDDGSDMPVAHITGNQCSSRLLSTCGAAVLVALPGATKEVDRLAPGSVVTAWITALPRHRV